MLHRNMSLLTQNRKMKYDSYENTFLGVITRITMKVNVLRVLLDVFMNNKVNSSLKETCIMHATSIIYI